MKGLSKFFGLLVPIGATKIFFPETNWAQGLASIQDSIFASDSFSNSPTDTKNGAEVLNEKLFTETHLYQVIRNQFINGDWRFMTPVLLCLLIAIERILTLYLATTKVSSGIALLTSVAGLTVVIILQLFYNYGVAKIDRLVNDTERASIAFVDVLVDFNTKETLSHST